MELYEEVKKDLDEIHDSVSRMWKSSLGNDIVLLIMLSVSCVLFGTMAVMNFCDGGWYIVLGIYYIILLFLMVVLGVRTVRRMKECKEHIRANDMWYENELNRLNIAKEESVEHDDR